jgi:SAM-dependent methyltransferase
MAPQPMYLATPSDREESVVEQQSETDGKNIAFWNELCGSNLASVLGITDASPRSLLAFDNWFLAYYPYIFLHVPYDELKDKDVLEVGLGYGTLAQKLAESGARYMGLDIADGPVAMAKHRLLQARLPGNARQGSILQAPFDDNCFDYVVTIGCLHHSGDLARAISECHRILRAGGKLIVMLYFAYSHRRWAQARGATIKYWLRERLGYVGPVEPADDREKWDYDHNKKGEAAPHTDFISVRSLRKISKQFSKFEYRLENINVEPPFENWPSRRDLLKSWWPRIWGLEIYATLQK